MAYSYKASEDFWEAFHALSPKSKARVREVWQLFKENPFHPSLGTHKIHRLSSRYKATIYSVPIEGDLRVIFKIDGDIVQTIAVGSHDLYR